MATSAEVWPGGRRPGSDVVAALRGGLVVSCQAAPGHPFDDPAAIALLAACAEQGGAVAVRIESAPNVRATRARVGVPIIGIKKVHTGAHRPFITPTLADCAELAAAGADIIALETVPDNRPDPGEVATLIERVHREVARPVMADVATIDEGMAAWSAGADLVASTLSGYTRHSASRTGPDLDLVAALAARGVRAVLEGRVDSPDQVRTAFERGAWSVVVGTAITDPLVITRRFAVAAPRPPLP
ncbi:N-acetylmannosamine-6-phosphate 2-epimerase [Actinopolymorpha alba]|uniref:N-acetylmannosamine-6-phosphate 2-epimerase n=1 Tax=Actinopolymorpha alba TaxID=533267 RepID=UPI00037CAB84|nr:N-acetylmannosamine-6-phosphate 2-epimerase [Actinopolymorpha alba]